MDIQDKQMRDSISIANYYIERASNEKKDITLLQLLKLVYIAHGYLLALLNQSFLNPKFDRVEAWKYGPVIPTVYHTFKHNARNPITQRGVVCLFDDEYSFVYPTISPEAEPVLDFVWKRYGGLSAAELVNLTHSKGTPWAYCYKEGENVVILDSDTELYYKALVREMMNYGK